MKATGWQQHSVRGFLAGVVRKRLKLKLSSKKVDGNRVYRIDAAAEPRQAGHAVQAPLGLNAMPRVKIGPALPDREDARRRDRAPARSRRRRASGPLAHRVPAATAPSPAPPSPVSRSGLSAAGRSTWATWMPRASVCSIARGLPRTPASAPSNSSRLTTDVRPGTMLAREWNGQMHRVAVLADGFAWNGKTYPSLSKVASRSPAPAGTGPSSSACATSHRRSLSS